MLRKATFLPQALLRKREPLKARGSHQVGGGGGGSSSFLSPQHPIAGCLVQKWQLVYKRLRDEELGCFGAQSTNLRKGTIVLVSILRQGTKVGYL